MIYISEPYTSMTYFLNPMGSAESNDDDHMQEVRKQIITKQAKEIVLKIVGRAVTDISKQSVDMPLTYIRLFWQEQKEPFALRHARNEEKACVSAQQISTFSPAPTTWQTGYLARRVSYYKLINLLFQLTPAL